jgi:hypothetical protein
MQFGRDKTLELIEKILKERPTFHQGETEIGRSFDPSESYMPKEVSKQLAQAVAMCHGIESEVVRYLASLVQPGLSTLETGAGLTTLVFAIKGARHVSITPNVPEIDGIRRYAQLNNISLDSVDFVAAASDDYLPRCEVHELDIVLLDGKHAFPWPMVDWFYTADRLKEGGLMIIDDVQLRSVSILQDFMKIDPGWHFIQNFGGKTSVYRKTRQSVHDVAWHMQPWTVGARPAEGFTRRWVGRIYRKLGRMLGQ